MMVEQFKIPLIPQDIIEIKIDNCSGRDFWALDDDPLVAIYSNNNREIEVRESRLRKFEEMGKAVRVTDNGEYIDGYHGDLQIFRFKKEYYTDWLKRLKASVYEWAELICGGYALEGDPDCLIRYGTENKRWNHPVGWILCNDMYSSAFMAWVTENIKPGEVYNPPEPEQEEVIPVPVALMQIDSRGDVEQTKLCDLPGQPQRPKPKREKVLPEPLLLGR